MTLPTYSFFEYFKIGDPATVQESKKRCIDLKNCRVADFSRYLQQISLETKEQLQDVIPENAILVPIPRSAPLVDGAQWPGLEICKVLRSAGYGRDIQPLLRRVTKVDKAAFQIGSKRPSVEAHFNSLNFSSAKLEFENVETIVLVDDVVTQGHTSIACMQRLMERYPNANYRLFCPVRTFFEAGGTTIKPRNGTIILYPSGRTFHDFRDAADDFAGFI